MGEVAPRMPPFLGNNVTRSSLPGQAGNHPRRLSSMQSGRQSTRQSAHHGATASAQGDKQHHKPARVFMAKRISAGSAQKPLQLRAQHSSSEYDSIINQSQEWIFKNGRTIRSALGGDDGTRPKTKDPTKE